MTLLELAKHATANGAQLVRPKVPGPGYDFKPLFTGNKRGWVILDAFSASAIVTVHGALSPEAQKKLEGLGLIKAVDICFKLINKANGAAQ